MLILKVKSKIPNKNERALSKADSFLKREERKYEFLWRFWKKLEKYELI